MIFVTELWKSARFVLYLDPEWKETIFCVRESCMKDVIGVKSEVSRRRTFVAIFGSFLPLSKLTGPPGEMS